jgi:hypothetical protein
MWLATQEHLRQVPPQRQVSLVCVTAQRQLGCTDQEQVAKASKADVLNESHLPNHANLRLYCGHNAKHCQQSLMKMMSALCTLCQRQDQQQHQNDHFW